MTADRDWDDDDRPSWREIDKARDRSGHRGSERSSSSPDSRSTRSQYMKKQLLKQAESAFQGKRGSAAYRKSVNALRDALGDEGFDKLATDFVAEHGLPDDDWSTLLLLLDCSDPTLAADALEALQKLIQGRSAAELTALRSKLRMLALTARDRRLRGLTAQILEQL